jgi:hypothetical protein
MIKAHKGPSRVMVITAQAQHRATMERELGTHSLAT